MEQRKKWRLERSINVGHILTTLALAGAVFGYAVKMDQRLTVLETQVTQQRDIDSKQDRYVSDVRQDLKDINQKLDRLIERATFRLGRQG